MKPKAIPLERISTTIYILKFIFYESDKFINLLPYTSK